LLSHLFALRLEQGERPLPVQRLPLLFAIVQQMHTHPDVDAHGFECLLPGLTIDNIVAHMVLGLIEIDRFGGKNSVEPGMSGTNGCWAMDVLVRWLLMVVGSRCQSIEDDGTGFEAGVAVIDVRHGTEVVNRGETLLLCRRMLEEGRQRLGIERASGQCSNVGEQHKCGIEQFQKSQTTQLCSAQERLSQSFHEACRYHLRESIASAWEKQDLKVGLSALLGGLPRISGKAREYEAIFG